MALSAQEQARLNALNAMLGPVQQATTAAPDEQMGTGERILRQIGNLPTAAGRSLGNLVGDTLQIAVPNEDKVRFDQDSAPDFFNVPAPRTTSDAVVDTVAGMASSLPSFVLPELGVAKLAGAAGAAPLLARAAGAGVSGYLNTQGTEGQAGGAEQGAIFAGLAGLGGLGWWRRLVPVLGLGAVAGGAAYANGASGQQAAVQGSVTALLGMLPGKHETPTRAAEKFGEEYGPHQEEQGPWQQEPGPFQEEQGPYQQEQGPFQQIMGPPSAPAGQRVPTQAYLDSMHASPGTSAEASARVFQGQGTNMGALSGASAADSAGAMLEQKYGLLPSPIADPGIVAKPNGINTDGIGTINSPENFVASERAAGRVPRVQDLQRRFRMPYADAEKLLGQYRPGPLDFMNREGGPLTTDRTADLARQRLIGGDATIDPDTRIETSQPSGPILPDGGPSNARPRVPGTLPDPAFRLIGGEAGQGPRDIQLPQTPRYDYQFDQHPELPLSEPTTNPIQLPQPSGYTRLLPFDQSTKPEVHGPFGRTELPSRMEGTPHVVSSALNPGDGRVLTGLDWQYGHDGVGAFHDIDKPAQDTRGFLVDDGHGNQRFATREEALPYAKAAGQVDADFGRNGEVLNSQDLRDPAASEKGGVRDATPAVETSQPTPAPEPLSKSVAALSGAPLGSDDHLLRSDISGMADVDARNEIQDRRDIINHPDTSASDKPYHMQKIREAMGLPDVEPELPAEDSPRYQQLRDQRYEGVSAAYSEDGEYRHVNIDNAHEGAMARVENQGLDFEDSHKLQEFDPETWSGNEKPPIDNEVKTPQKQISEDLQAILDDKDLHIDYDEAERQAATHGEDTTTPEPEIETSQSEPVAAKQPRKTKLKAGASKAEVVKDIANRNPRSKVARTAARKATKLSLKQAESGFVDAQMLATIGRYGIGPLLVGGPIGASIDKENRLRGYIYGAAMTMAGLHFGPKLIKLLMNEGVDRIKTDFTSIKNVAKQPGAEFSDLLHNISAEDAGATGDGIARIARRIQKGFTLSDDAREILSRSNLSGMLSTLRDSLEGMRGTYGRLSQADKDLYEAYQKAEAYVTNGSGNRVPNMAVEAKWASDMSHAPEFQTQAMNARRLRVEAQEMIANSMLPSELKSAINKTLGTYHTDSFRIFNEAAYRPTDVQIDKAVDELAYNELFTGYNKMALRKIVSSYLDNIYRNRQIYEGGSGNSKTLDQILHGKMRIDPALEAKILKASGMRSVDQVVTSQFQLPQELRTALTKAISDGTYLTPAFRDMLGYYSDPLEKEAATLTKLVPAARVAKQFELIMDGRTKLGLKMAMTGQEYSDLYNILQSNLKTAPNATERNLIQRKLLDLKNRTLLPQSDGFGNLAGKFVPTDLADTLPDMDKGIYGQNTTAVGRGVDQFNRFLKVGQTAMNPVSHIRQIMTTPILASLAGTTPMDLWEGFKAAQGKGAKYEKILARMRELGIADTASINTEFNTAARQALTGYYDRTLMDKFLQTPVISHIVESYHYPDTALRIGTFLKHEQRLLSRFGADITAGRLPDAIPKEFMPGKPVAQVAAKWAEREALRYTNRYTMNYANIPGGLGALRKMPFVSLYLSYQYEIARIMKNVTMDAIHGTGLSADPGSNRALALAKVAGVAAVPFALEKLGTSQLSEKDRKDWETSRKLDQPYAQDRFKYVYGRKADGSFKYLDFSPLIPTDEWNRFLRAVGDGSGANVLANNPVFGLDNTPALNVASEIITGKSSRTGRELNTPGRVLDAARQEIAPAAFGGYEFDNLMRALQTNDKGELGITRMGSGKGYSITDLLFTYATGLRPTSVNPEWQKHTAVQQFQNQISTERQYMMDTMRSDVTPAVKQLAAKRYNDAVQSIAAHFGQTMKDAN